MATNIQSQSQAELKCYLEECLHACCPAASNQEVAHAVEVAMGLCGYMLDHAHDQHGQQSREQFMHDTNQLSTFMMCIASVRDATISAAQCLSESSLRMVAIACAWVSYAATCEQARQMNQNQQKAACN